MMDHITCFGAAELLIMDHITCRCMPKEEWAPGHASKKTSETAASKGKLSPFFGTRFRC